MQAADPTLVRVALEASGSFLNALAAMIIVFGILVVLSSITENRIAATVRPGARIQGGQETPRAS